MTDEEKKAIEYFKSNLEMTKEMGKKWGFQEEIKNNEIILELIEKQAKEIEELKNITKSYDSFLGTEKIVIADKKFFDNGYFRENYVSKDKIKAKIEIRKEEKENCKDSIEEKYLLREIYVLQSLLEKE